ncbi:MAG TPA: anti-sigma factor [Streptosporangiaceae bacterium]|jgi:anti-sigma-K factor RskA
MTSGRADLHTLAGPYALNALPPRDCARFERHLAACEPCAQEVRGLRETAARLAAATAVPPAPQLRDRVLAQVARTRQLPPAPARPGAARRPGWRGLAWPARTRTLTLAASAVFAVAAVLLGALVLVSQHKLSQAETGDHVLAAVLTAPDAKMMTSPAVGGGTVTVVVSRMKGALAFSSAGLPALPGGMRYELWVMGPQPHSAGMLPAPQHGMTSPVMATGLLAGEKVELTVEPSGGVPRPTSSPLLMITVT